MDDGWRPRQPHSGADGGIRAALPITAKWSGANGFGVPWVGPLALGWKRSGCVIPAAADSRPHADRFFPNFHLTNHRPGLNSKSSSDHPVRVEMAYAIRRPARRPVHRSLRKDGSLSGGGFFDIVRPSGGRLFPQFAPLGEIRGSKPPESKWIKASQSKRPAGGNCSHWHTPTAR